MLGKLNGVNREQQDQFAYDSHQKAARATETKGWAKELIPTLGHDSDGLPISVDYDEVIRPNTSVEDLAKLRPSFDPKGCVTAGNSSAISDGASALLMMSEDAANELTQTARSHPLHGRKGDPAVMGRGPVTATKKRLSGRV